MGREDVRVERKKIRSCVRFPVLFVEVSFFPDYAGGVAYIY